MRHKTYAPKVAHTCLYVIVLLFACFIPFLSLLTSSSHAQVPPITPSGLHTQVSGPFAGGQTQYDITGGTRPDGGVNLFHSFGNFNVPTNNIANFLNTGSVDLNGTLLPPNLPTANILGRVTEQQDPSIIFGMIQTNGTGGFGQANLFLMNPHGFLFGPGATVNVGGMVSFTTADYLRLADGVQFNAIPDIAADALLTASPVTAFGFLGTSAASIAIQGGNLEVLDGKTLSFIGGPRVFTTDTGVTVPSGVSMSGGNLSAPNGLIYMATETSPGEVSIPTLSGHQLGSLGSPSSDPAVIRIRSGEFVMDHAFLTATNTTNTVQSAIEVTVQGAITLMNASTISTETSGTGHGSDVHITTPSLQMDMSSIKSTTMGDGHGGDISIVNVQNVNLTNGAQIASSTSATGQGGNITILAPDMSASAEILISGFDRTGALSGITTFLSDPNSGLPLVSSGVFSTTSGSVPGGIGGNIVVTAPRVHLENSGQIATITSGDGAGGNVTFTAEALNVITGAQVMSYAGFNFDPNTFGATEGIGKAGDITVTAHESVRIADADPVLQFEGSVIRSQAFGTGDAGSLTVSTLNLTLENGGTISSQNLGTSNAGNITISTPASLSITGQDPIGDPSQISNLAFSGNAGAVAITAGSVNIADSGTIQTLGIDGGDITLQVAHNLTIESAGSIQTSGGTTAPGNITLTADTILLSGGPNVGADTGRSRIQTTGDAETGNIEIHARDLTISNGSRINSDATAGEPGQINISAETVMIADNAKVRMDTSNPNSGGGLIEIDASSITLNQGIIQTETVGSGAAGTLNLHADNLTLAGGFINSETHFLGGRGGDVTVTVTDRLSITGRFNGSDTDSARPAGIDTFTSSGGGDAGSISVNSGTMELSDGAQLLSSSFSSGLGGTITIGASNTFTSTASAVLSTATQATGGDISIAAGQSVTLNNGSLISASSTGTGNAGNISINAGHQLDMRDSSIKTVATQSSGGNVDVQVGERARLVNSTIDTSVHGGSGNGGNITIDPNIVVLQNSQIIAQAVQGAGGNITIFTPLFLADQTSLVSASSQFGLNGTVTIQSPTSNLSGSVGSLPSSISQQQALQAQRCALAGGASSSFIIAGRDTIPTEPGGWLAQPLGVYSPDNGLLAETIIDEQRPTMLAMAQTSDTISLRRLTPAGFLTQRFAGNGSDGCRS